MSLHYTPKERRALNWAVSEGILKAYKHPAPATLTSYHLKMTDAQDLIDHYRYCPPSEKILMTDALKAADYGHMVHAIRTGKKKRLE